MKILAIADRPPQRKLAEYQDEGIDLVVTLGDLGFFELQGLQSLTGMPKIGVYGNHCSGNYFHSLDIQNMHLQTWEFNGVTFGGFEGCVRYKQNPEAIMYTQEEATQMLADFPKVDVMLVHCPPFGINDDQSEVSHTGFKALLDYLDTHSPAHLFHGHTYPKQGEEVTQYKETKIHYIYTDQVLEI